MASRQQEWRRDKTNQGVKRVDVMVPPDLADWLLSISGGQSLPKAIIAALAAYREGSK